jgi:hypothetical protein
LKLELEPREGKEGIVPRTTRGPAVRVSKRKTGKRKREKGKKRTKKNKRRDQIQLTSRTLILEAFPRRAILHVVQFPRSLV